MIKKPIVTSTLVIECKKQEKKPWVFFEQENENINSTSVWVRPKEAYKWFSEEFSKHYYYKQKPCSFHFPAFVERREPEPILDAINQVLDAFLYTVNSSHYPAEVVHFVYPVIILDGLLFSAKIDSDGEIELTEREYLQLRAIRGLTKPEEIFTSESTSKISRTQEIIIDIVKIEALDQFLNIVTK